MVKVLVTGGAGFIGSHIVDALVEKGHDVHVVDNYLAGKHPDRFNARATYHEKDIRSKDLVSVLQGVDTVFHTAAQPRVPVSIEQPVASAEVNIIGTIAVLDAAVKAKVRRVVHSSSGSVYGDQETLPISEDLPKHPVNPYGLQKYSAEMFVSLWPSIYQIETVSLRYFNVYGPRLDPNGPYALAVGKFLMARKNNEPITIYGDGTVTRDFTHVHDVARANVLAMESANVGKGEAINIGAGRNISIKALADMFGGEIVYGPPRVEAHDSRADNQRAKKLLGWEPQIKVEDGIAELKKLFGIA